MTDYKLVRIRPSAGVDSVQVHSKLLAFEVAGQAYVTAAPSGLSSGFKKSQGWYKVPAELAGLYANLTFGGTGFLDVMTQDEAIVLEVSEGSKQQNLDTAHAVERDAQNRLAQIGMEYEVHPTDWPRCIRSAPTAW